MGGKGSGGWREGAGRKPTVDEPVRDRFLNGLRLGLPLVQAAAVAGVGARTVYDWQQREREGDDAYDGISDAIEIARQFGRAVVLQRIIKAGQDPKNWTASAWVLERTAPQEFARTDRVVIERAQEDYAREATSRLMSALPPNVARMALEALAGRTPVDIEAESVVTVHGDGTEREDKDERNVHAVTRVLADED